jgi:hypothetical protein
MFLLRLAFIDFLNFFKYYFFSLIIKLNRSINSMIYLFVYFFISLIHNKKLKEIILIKMIDWNGFIEVKIYKKLHLIIIKKGQLYKFVYCQFFL